MCGSATLATLVSSTSMNVASITVPAMIHGLIAGLMAPGAGMRSSTTSVCRTVGIARSPVGVLLGENGRFDVHSRTQHLIATGNRIEHDLHGNPLNNFDVIAGGVFRRQQAHAGARRRSQRIHV